MCWGMCRDESCKGLEFGVSIPNLVERGRGEQKTFMASRNSYFFRRDKWDFRRTNEK